MENMMQQVDESLVELRESFTSSKTRSASWRKSQLKGLKRMLEEQEDEIFKVLWEDLGKPRAEAFRDEVGFLHKSLNLALSCVKKWMSKKKVHVPVIAFPTSGEIVPEPLGLILILSTWNFPLGLSLEPLIGAIAAGNVAVIKPSELAPATSAFLAKYIPGYMDNEAVKVIEGGAPVAQLLLDKKWDKIFFTGTARIARIIMTAAAKHLTPLTLELGGKCPCILDYHMSSRDREVSMKRIVTGKWGCCLGQACVGIDYLLVEKKHASKAISMLKERIKKFYGERPRETNSISRIINHIHFMRLKNLIEDPTVKGSIVYGGAVDEANLFIEPTILLDPPLESEIMTEEIFGPFLPIITLEKLSDSIGFIRSRPQPLAVYAFTHDEKFKKSIISETSSGCVTFNDAIIQFACDTLPFGGVGGSGFGRYHGKFSFNEFSHEKAVVRRSLITELSFGYPPWSDYKLSFLRAAYNFDYLNLFLLLIGVKRK